LSQEVLDKVVDYEYHLAVIGRLPYPDNIISVPVLKSKLLFISKEDIGERVSLRNWPITRSSCPSRVGDAGLPDP